MPITIDSHQVFPDNTKLDLISYNDIYKSNNPKMLLFLKENPHLINFKNITLNYNNNWIIDLIIENITIVEKENKTLLISLSEYNNDKLIIFLLNNKKYINWFCFNENANNYAVEYLINNPDKIDIYSFLKNTNDKAVEYVINYYNNKNVNNICSSFSSNTNNKAVEYLVKNPHLIYYKAFNLNDNDIAVEYLINNPDKIILYEFHLNNNIKATEYLIKNPDKIIAKKFLDNINNSKILEYISNNTESFINIYIEQNYDNLLDILEEKNSYQDMYNYVYDYYISAFIL